MAYEPLIRDSDGSGNVALRKASTTEENYLAYRLGLYLADSANIANALVTTSSTNGTSIGSFANTYYNAVLGQHGFEFTDITTETTTLYQKNSVLNETDSDCYRPLEHSIDDGQTRIDEFDSGDLDELTNRLISRVFTSDYPGTIKLATSSPSGDYTYIQEAFRDTRANDDSDVNTYNLYKRTSMSAPDTIQPFRIKRHNDSDAGFYQGLQLMTDRQIEHTFGARARHLISPSASTVGSYQLRTAVQGAPTDTGTWVAQGVAVDTRNTAVEKDFTRNSQSLAFENFINERSSTFTGAFEGTFTSNVNFVSDFLRDFLGDFVGNFVTEGTNNGQGDYLGNFGKQFEGNYARDFVRDFTGDFLGEYIETTSSTSATFYEKTDPRYLWRYDRYQNEITVRWNEVKVVDEAGAPETQTSIVDDEDPNITYYRGALRETFPSAYLYEVYRVVNTDGATYTGDFNAGTFVTESTTNSLRFDFINFVGDYIGETFYNRNSTQNSAVNFIGDFISEKGFTGNIEENFTNEDAFVGDFVGAFLGDFTGNYSGFELTDTINTINTYTLYVRVD